MSSDVETKPRKLRRWVGYYQAALLVLIALDGTLLQIGRLGKWPIASTLFYCGLGLFLLMIVSAFADKILVRLGIVAKEKPGGEAPALDEIVERPPIERQASEDRQAGERDEPSSGYQLHGGELPAPLTRGARASWFVAPPDDEPEKPRS